MEELNTEVKNTEVKKAKNNTNKNSIIFLVVVLLSTIAMAIYNNSIQKDIEKLKNNISGIETSIKEVESDKKLQIYSLLELNSSVIKSYKSMNNITRYINHMNVIQAKYDLLFKGFTLNNGELFTNIEIVSDDKAIAYQKTRDFLKNYRIDSKALFDLQFVNTIEGMDNMKFKGYFKIKD